ncbi:MAG TPA: class 1 fructose-bisphosphatase [Methanospirillum sp.]|uniref:class 1 fructose-bisphosphatase n=1 Tax=Methanospirillum sp. TaxID=45200 RepID=UPI002D1DEEC2|nr:class 1 fructose-bisphosphatase [Methanospirillum sp.]HWQ63931.1 class 1 fructose-bisphosphatase [Methanospirillum sp.]
MVYLQKYLEDCGCDPDLVQLIRLISRQMEPIRKAFFDNQFYENTLNASGEVQAALDKWSDAHLIKVIGESGYVREIASEEQEDIIRFENSRREYAMVMDPLDGSSLISTNLAVGTIVGIYESGGVMQKGSNLKAACYTLFGPLTVLVVSVGKGVQSFAWDPESEHYYLLKKSFDIPEGKMYGSGGVYNDYIPAHEKVLSYFDEEGFKVRYSGSFVADCHQLLVYGGIYTYPALKKSPKGKLRLLFEANPLGYIITQAGGAITDGYQSPLDIQPEKVHQRTPIYIGSAGIIKKIEEIYKEQ